MAKYYIGQINPKEILKCFKLNEIENTTHQNVWSASKAVLWGKLKHLTDTLPKKNLILII